MSSPQIKHNKKRNVGIVYEQLVRRMTAAIVEGDRRTCDSIRGIIGRYFVPGKPLAEELQVYESVRRNRGKARNLCNRIVNELSRYSKRFSGPVSVAEKGKLIAEINRTIGPGLFEVNVPDYKAMASVYVLLTPERAVVSESVDRATIKEALVSYMSSAVQDVSGDSPMDPLAYNIAAKRFNRGISRDLSENQRNLLGEYVKSMFGGTGLGLLIRNDRLVLLEKIDRYIRTGEVKDDVMKQRLVESVDLLKKLPALPVPEAVERVMLFHALVEEMESNDE